LGFLVRRDVLEFGVEEGGEKRAMGVFQGSTIVEDEEQQQQVRKLVVHYGDMNTAEPWLRQAQHLASLVASDAASVKAFLGRWKAIENRLLQLPPLLTEMAHLHCLSDNKVCKELLQVLMGSPPC